MNNKGRGSGAEQEHSLSKAKLSTVKYGYHAACRWENISCYALMKSRQFALNIMDVCMYACESLIEL